jgi:hypothetical protein
MVGVVIHWVGLKRRIRSSPSSMEQFRVYIIYTFFGRLSFIMSTQHNNINSLDVLCFSGGSIITHIGTFSNIEF